MEATRIELAYRKVNSHRRSPDHAPVSLEGVMRECIDDDNENEVRELERE